MTKTNIFNEAAELYDEVRPGYPSQLTEDVIKAAGLAEGSKILEIGCGTGQATEAFSKRGFSVTCIEAGDKLAGLASERLAAYPKTRVLNVTFEGWQQEHEAYDLVMSATAFHHMTRGLKYQKAALALKPGGALALFWNWRGEREAGLQKALDRAYAEHAPELAQAHRDSTLQDRIQGVLSEINASGLFEDPSVREYPWSIAYDEESYIKLLETYSDHRPLAVKAKNGLYGAIQGAIRDNHGKLDNAMVAVLFMAKPRLKNA